MMIKNEIDLKALNSFGICKAYIEGSKLTVKVYGVSGCLKAWLTGKNTVELGNIVNGSITREIDLSPYEGILLTQSGRQMFYGKLPEKEKASSPQNEVSSLPFNDSYTWQEITTRAYPSESLSVRYILSHKCFYNAFLLHGRYFYGTNGDKCAIAIECNIKNEPHPFLHLSPYAVYRDGFMIVCADTASKKFFTYEY